MITDEELGKLLDDNARLRKAAQNNELLISVIAGGVAAWWWFSPFALHQAHATLAAFLDIKEGDGIARLSFGLILLALPWSVYVQRHECWKTWRLYYAWQAFKKGGSL